MTEILKEAVRASGLPVSKVAELADVPIPSLTRFMRDERSLSLKGAEKLMAYFGLTVVPAEPKAK